MDGPGLELTAFAVGTIGNSVKAVPQFVRTAVRGQVAGLSAAAVWLALVANVLWSCFGIAVQDWRFVVLGVLQVALSAGTLARYVAGTGWRGSTRPASLAVPACLVFAVLAVTGAGVVLAAVGAALGVIIGLPQLVHLWRRRRTPTDVAGVAPTEHAVVVVAQVAWTTYWFARGHPVAAVAAAWGGLVRAGTLLLLRQQRARSMTAASRSVTTGDP